MEYKIKFMCFSKVITARGYRVATKKALQIFFNKWGYPKKLSALIKIQKKTKSGWGMSSYWDMREALKLLD